LLHQQATGSMPRRWRWRYIAREAQDLLHLLDASVADAHGVLDHRALEVLGGRRERLC
jgi:hypothetical protein